MKKIILFCLVIALSITAYFMLSADKSVNSSTIGFIEYRDVNLSFRASGKLKDVLVDEGDEIQQGQLLATLYDDIAQETQNQASARLDIAKANLSLLLEGAQIEEITAAQEIINQLNAELRYTERLLQRQNVLLKDNAIAKNEYDSVLSKKNAILAQIRGANDKLTILTKGTRQQTIDQAQAALQEAQSSYNLATIAANDTQLFALEDGIVISRFHEKGSVIGSGTPVFNVNLNNNVYVRAYIESDYLQKIKLGTKVDVTVFNEVYQGEIVFISPSAEFTPKQVQTLDLRADLVYRIRIKILQPSKNLHQGAFVDVSLKGL